MSSEVIIVRKRTRDAVLVAEGLPLDPIPLGMPAPGTEPGI